MTKSIAFSLLLSSLLFAAEEDLTQILEETTEIATKTRLNADYVPGTVSIIKAEELKSLGILNLNQPNALDMIVGMDSSVNAMRGSGAMYGGQGVKIKWLLNGRAINSQIWSGSINGRGIISFPITVEQIDRIEIIRGPDSAIYGDNAIFGVINIITKKDVNSVSSSVSYQGDSKSGKAATANIYKASDDFGLSASISAFDSDGYSMYVGENGNFANSVTGNHTPGYGPGYLPNGSRGYSFITEATYRDWRMWLNRLETESMQGAFGTWYPTNMLPSDNGKYVRKEEYTQLGIQREFELSDARIVPKIGIDTYEFGLKDFVEISSVYINNATNADGTRNAKYKEEKKYAALDGDFKNGSHHFSGGLLVQSTKNIKDEKYQNFSYVGPWPTTDIWSIVSPYSSAVTVDQNTQRGQKAFYFQDAWDVTDKTTVTYGARYDAFDGDIKSYGWSPRIALVYRADEENVLKAQYARAFRPPTFAEMGNMGNSNIKSETVDTVELGHIYKSDSFTLKNTIFDSRIYDMITYDDMSYYTINLPNRGEIKGLEMEVKYSKDSYEIEFNQAFYDTHRGVRSYVSPDSPDVYTYSGGEFPLAANYAANLILKINQNSQYPTTFWYHYISGKVRKSEFTVSNPANPDNAKGGSNGSVAPQDYLNITQQFKNVFKNADLSMGIQNVFGKTMKTLYMPLTQPNDQDIPYMRQMFWMNLSYKF